MLEIMFWAFAVLCVVIMFRFMGTTAKTVTDPVIDPPTLRKRDWIEMPDPHRSTATTEEFSAAAERLHAQRRNFTFGVRNVKTEDGYSGHLSCTRHEFREGLLHFWLEIEGGKLKLSIERLCRNEEDHTLSRVTVWDASGDELVSVAEPDRDYIQLEIGDSVRIQPNTYQLLRTPLRFIVRVESAAGEKACFAITSTDEFPYMH